MNDLLNPEEIEIEKLQEMMEEMAGSKEELGERQPGERGKYEETRINVIEMTDFNKRIEQMAKAAYREQ